MADKFCPNCQKEMKQVAGKANQFFCSVCKWIWRINGVEYRPVKQIPIDQFEEEIHSLKDSISKIMQKLGISEPGPPADPPVPADPVIDPPVAGDDEPEDDW